MERVTVVELKEYDVMQECRMHKCRNVTHGACVPHWCILHSAFVHLNGTFPQSIDDLRLHANIVQVEECSAEEGGKDG